MNKIFTFKEACEKGIDKIKQVNWPEGHYLELNLIGAIPAPKALYRTYKNSEDYFFIPVNGIEQNSRDFTFVDNIQSYDEYFDKHIFPVLMQKVKEAKNINKVKVRRLQSDR